MSGGLSIPGRFGKLEVSSGANFENFGGIKDIGMSINIDELECTTHDSNGAREYIPNHHDVTLDISGRWLDGNPGQEIVMTAVFAKTRFDFQFFMKKDIGSSLKKYSGKAFATSANPNAPLDDTAALDLTLRCSGVIQSAQ